MQHIYFDSIIPAFCLVQLDIILNNGGLRKIQLHFPVSNYANNASTLLNVGYILNLSVKVFFVLHPPKELEYCNVSDYATAW